MRLGGDFQCPCSGDKRHVVETESCLPLLSYLRECLWSPRVIKYLSSLPNGKVVLWCYLIWWGNHGDSPFRSVAWCLAKFCRYQCSHRHCINSQRWWPQVSHQRWLAKPFRPVRHAILRIKLFVSHQGQGLHSCFLAFGHRVDHCCRAMRRLRRHGHRAQEDQGLNLQCAQSNEHEKMALCPKQHIPDTRS